MVPITKEGPATKKTSTATQILREPDINQVIDVIQIEVKDATIKQPIQKDHLLVDLVSKGAPQAITSSTVLMILRGPKISQGSTRTDHLQTIAKEVTMAVKICLPPPTLDMVTATATISHVTKGIREHLVGAAIKIAMSMAVGKIMTIEKISTSSSPLGPTTCKDIVEDLEKVTITVRVGKTDKTISTVDPSNPALIRAVQGPEEGREISMSPPIPVCHSMKSLLELDSLLSATECKVVRETRRTKTQKVTTMNTDHGSSAKSKTRLTRLINLR